jgi:predicted PurR-regulated permease PerM
MLITVIILGVLLVLSVYFVWNLLRKVEKLEDMLANLGSYVSDVTELIVKSQERIQEIDQKGTFQSDDEVGFFFENLKEIQNILNSANLDEPRATSQEEERS